jgi:GNAT superfamily N-acetyltransferase
MTEFYADSPFTLNRERAAEAFTALLSDERLGRVWFIQAQGQDVGYVVVTFCFGMEYGGLNAIVDDWFVRPAFRGAGLGTGALEHVKAFCLRNGVRAILVETGRDNEAAKGVYRRVGFIETDRLHMTLGLADPTHVV